MYNQLMSVALTQMLMISSVTQFIAYDSEHSADVVLHFLAE